MSLSPELNVRVKYGASRPKKARFCFREVEKKERVEAKDELKATAKYVKDSHILESRKSIFWTSSNQQRAVGSQEIKDSKNEDDGIDERENAMGNEITLWITECCALDHQINFWLSMLYFKF